MGNCRPYATALLHGHMEFGVRDNGLSWLLEMEKTMSNPALLTINIDEEFENLQKSLARIRVYKDTVGLGYYEDCCYTGLDGALEELETGLKSLEG